MCRFAAAAGAQPETLTGLSGLGDLTLTATSEKSRNYLTGLELGRGLPLARDRTVEGVATARAVARLADERGIDMPLTRTVARVTGGELTVAEAAGELLARPLERPSSDCPAPRARLALRHALLALQIRTLDLGLGRPGRPRRRRPGMGRRPQLPGPQPHARHEEVGDLGFFYHSQAEKAVVGIVEVIAEAHHDSTTETRAGNASTSGRSPAAAPGDAGRMQGRPAPRRHGAGQQHPPLGPAGDGGRMGAWELGGLDGPA